MENIDKYFLAPNPEATIGRKWAVVVAGYPGGFYECCILGDRAHFFILTEDELLQYDLIDPESLGDRQEGKLINDIIKEYAPAPKEAPARKQQSRPFPFRRDSDQVN